MSFHWYFTSALPRSLLGTLPLIPAGLVLECRVRPYVLFITAYIVLYSFLPHKEVSVCVAISINSWKSCFPYAIIGIMATVWPQTDVLCQYFLVSKTSWTGINLEACSTALEGSAGKPAK